MGCATSQSVRTPRITGLGEALIPTLPSMYNLSVLKFQNSVRSHIRRRNREHAVGGAHLSGEGVLLPWAGDLRPLQPVRRLFGWDDFGDRACRVHGRDGLCATVSTLLNVPDAVLAQQP
ncbi:hypothetical protein ANCCAN_07550 [Ancylostoma caninum]|uniref:Uncharacterized protein n=1 Tax=Ancylostoma caninum TaxID=29170 RepID=A0A368GPR5_ANCCA|nr:hypothetical protein ANCCAN_07550 [Ancylostoma caninum]